MPLNIINGGNLDTNIDGENSSGNYFSSFSGFSLQYLYNSGNIRHRYSTGYRAPDAYLQSGSGLYLNSYPFYRINVSGLPSYYVRYNDGNTYHFLSSSSGIIYLTETGTISISDINGIKTISNYIAPTGISITAPSNVYTPDSFNPADHLLICYNQNSQDSIDIKNFYFQTRPELADANVLPLSCNPAFSGEMTDVYDYINNIRAPIVNYILNSNKPIRYVTLLYDIGIRLTGSNSGTLSSPNNYPSPWDNLNDIELLNQITGGVFLPIGSVAGSLHNFFYLTGYHSRQNLHGLRQGDHVVAGNQFYDSSSFNWGFYDSLLLAGDYSGAISTANSLKPWKRYSISQFPYNILLTHISAKNKTDVSGYIKKIGEAELYNSYYRRGNKTNKNFYLWGGGVSGLSGQRPIDHADTINNMVEDYYIAKALTGVNSTMSVKTCLYNYSLNGFVSENNWGKSPIFSGRDIAGIHHDGLHSNEGLFASGLSSATEGEYSYNNQAMFTGDNWYLMLSTESYNGQNYAISDGKFVPHETIIGGHGTAFSWLRSGAFGGTGYSNCPVGLCVHATEPHSLRANIPAFFSLWYSGFPFVECAWNGQNSSYTPLYNQLYYPIGDPLIVI